MKAKTKLTKLWSVLLALVMVVGMLPTVALATGSTTATETADFYADPTAALTLLNTYKNAGAEDSTWDSSTRTLTLKGVNFETTAATAVKLPDGSTIVLNGDNTIKGVGSSSEDSYGIYADGALTIQGTGTLNVTGGDTTSSRSCGIYANNGNVIISGGTITATGGTSGRASLGIYSKGNFTISGTADVTGKGGTATGDGSFGINAEGEVIISGGKVKAIGGAGKGSDGLYSGNGQINISGGKVEAFGGDAPSAGGSFGIFAQTSGANVTITGTADVTARGGESASDRSYGIYSRNPVTISGGKVEAFGGEGCYPGYGINKANISGGTVTAASEYGDAINNVTTGSGFKTISFDRNGGSGEMIAYTNADSYILPANGFTAPADKEFMGWSESSTGDVIEDTTVNATDGKTLYAIWKINVADFNADPTAALALLNATKTGTADSEWNSSTNTLTLNGVNFETTAATAVRLPADSTIILNGVNTIKGGDSDSSKCYGIYALGKLTIQGSGTLNVTGGATTGYYSSYGIYASRDLTIKSGTVIATGGTVSQDYDSHGIFVYSGYVTIESGTVIATGGTAGEDSCGINSDYVSIKGGKVEATGGTAGVHSYGIYLYENITIEGGTVIAKANTKVMNKAPSALPTAYQWRTSESGAYNKYPDSAYTWNAAHTYLEIKKLEYTVTFDANGGTGTMADVTDVLGDYTLPENGFTAPEGKQFKGWSVDGKEKAVGDKITVSANTTVKAVWEDIEYTVTVTNGTASPSQAAAGATVTLTANRAPSGQVFDKWVSESGNVTLADATSATTTFTMPAGNVTAKATYKNIPVVTHTVTFEANGGSGSMAAVTGVLGTYTLPANGFTAPDGKQFKAWSVDGKEKAVGDKITVTADTTVKAVWENIPATPIEYEILDGANSSWTQNSDGSLSIRGSGAFSEFVGVKVDGKSVDEKYYTVKEGSTIVTLKAGYLNTLTVGSHTLEMIWTDGSASTTFSVNAKSPQTGDNSMMALWIAVLFVSGFGVVATAVYGKKRKSVK